MIAKEGYAQLVWKVALIFWFWLIWEWTWLSKGWSSAISATPPCLFFAPAMSVGVLWSWIHVIHVFSGFLHFEIQKFHCFPLVRQAWILGMWVLGPMHALKHKMQSFNGTRFWRANCHTFCHSCCHANFVTSQLSSQGKKDSSQAQSSHHSHHIKLVHFGHETMWIWRLWMQMNSHLSILEAFSLHKFGCRTDFRCLHKPF